MSYYSPPRQAAGLIVCLAACAAAAGAGALASRDAPEFYAQLQRPSWAPPASLFGPVWTILYTLQAVAAWLVWREVGAAGRRRALLVFAIQLAVNALWTWLFFAWRLGGLAFAEIVLLDGLIVLTALLFLRIRPLSAVLLAPYLAWVLFATALTWAIWRSNEHLL